MVDVDGTAVIVALPSIRTAIGFSDSGLSWVVNAFFVTYAGFRLLGGRLGDLLGQKSLFGGSLLVFSVASAACALGETPGEFIVARAAQGAAGAVIVTSALSLIVQEFREPERRAKAIATYSFAAACGGALGLLFGGSLTSALNWRWIFLASVPLGIALAWLCLTCLVNTNQLKDKPRLDIAGAVTMTLSLMAAVYTIVHASEAGWLSADTGVLALVVTLLLGAFALIEARAATPVVPAMIFKSANFTVCCIINALLSAATSAGVFVSLYLQWVMGYEPYQAGLAYLPFSLAMAVFSLGLADRLVNRWGPRIPMVLGLSVAALGLALLALTTAGGNAMVDVLPAVTLLGLGAGIACTPMLICAMQEMPRVETGAASGLIGTCSSIGRALGLAVLTSASAARMHQLLESGSAPRLALNRGYHLAFILGAIFAAVAVATAVALIRRER